MHQVLTGGGVIFISLDICKICVGCIIFTDVETVNMNKENDTYIKNIYIYIFVYPLTRSSGK